MFGKGSRFSRIEDGHSEAVVCAVGALQRTIQAAIIPQEDQCLGPDIILRRHLLDHRTDMSPSFGLLKDFANHLIHPAHGRTARLSRARDTDRVPRCHAIITNHVCGGPFLIVKISLLPVGLIRSTALPVGSAGDDNLFSIRHFHDKLHDQPGRPGERVDRFHANDRAPRYKQAGHVPSPGTLPCAVVRVTFSDTLSIEIQDKQVVCRHDDLGRLQRRTLGNQDLGSEVGHTGRQRCERLILHAPNPLGVLKIDRLSLGKCRTPRCGHAEHGQYKTVQFHHESLHIQVVLSHFEGQQ